MLKFKIKSSIYIFDVLYRIEDPNKNKWYHNLFNDWKSIYFANYYKNNPTKKPEHSTLSFNSKLSAIKWINEHNSIEAIEAYEKEQHALFRKAMYDYKECIGDIIIE